MSRIWSYFFPLAGLVLLVGCAGYLLPSRAIIVDLAVTSASQDEVVGVIQGALHDLGFSRDKKDGFGKITGSQDVIDYSKSSRVGVAISLANASQVYLRITSRSGEWTPEAESTFVQIVSVLELRWPRSVNIESRH